MSIKVMTLVWDGFPAAGSELLAMLALADHSNIASQSSRGLVKYTLSRKRWSLVGSTIGATAAPLSRDSGFFRGEHESELFSSSFSGLRWSALKGTPVPIAGRPSQRSPHPLLGRKRRGFQSHQLEPFMANSSGASRQSSPVSEFEKQHRLNIEAAIAAEKKAVASIKRMARNNSAALESLWRWGDGAGGGILDMIAKELGLQSPASAYPSPVSASKKQIIGNALRTKVFERDTYRCVHCATHLSLTVDHIKPESKGGTLDFDNLQTLCRPCNSRKGVK